MVMERLSEQEQKAMLHARANWAFLLACQNGHLDIASGYGKYALNKSSQQCCMHKIIMLFVGPSGMVI